MWRTVAVALEVGKSHPSIRLASNCVMRSASLTTADSHLGGVALLAHGWAEEELV